MNIDDQPLVSVLTPVYNGATYLAECIESVLRQTYQKFEYIIVDNCSTDGTLEIAERYAARDSRIQVHTNDKFVDVIANHNIAFNLMSPAARYCKVVSSDDFIFPQCLAKMVELFQTNPSAGIVGAFQLSGTVVRWQGFRYPRTIIPGREIGRHCLLWDQEYVDGQPVLGFGSPTSLMYRADLIRNAPAFYPNSSPHSDTSACFKTLQSSDFGFVYEVLAYERIHSETQTSMSTQLNRYISANLSDLQHYGSFYLSDQELKRQVKRTLNGYHRFLVVNLFSGSRDKEFWVYHKGRLEELGYPLTRFTLLKAAVATVLEESMNPKLAIGKLKKRLFGESGARAVQPGSKQKKTLVNGNKIAPSCSQKS
jgi:glycosyltransferase involved in cell wall biosynthesis